MKKSEFPESFKMTTAMAMIRSGHKFTHADVFMSSVRNWLVTIHDEKGKSYTLLPAVSAAMHFKSLNYVVSSLAEIGVHESKISISISSKCRRPVKITDKDIDVLNRLGLLSDINAERTKEGYRVAGLLGKEKVPFFIFNTNSTYRKKKAYGNRKGAILFARRKELPGYSGNPPDRDEDLIGKDAVPYRRAERLVREGKITEPLIKMTSYGEWETFGTYLGRRVKLLPLVKPKIKSISYVSPARAINHMLNLGFPRRSIVLLGNEDADDYHYAISEKAAIAFLYCDIVDNKDIEVVTDEKRGYQVVMKSRYSDAKFVVASITKNGNKRAVPFMKTVESINGVLSRIGVNMRV